MQDVPKQLNLSSQYKDCGCVFAVNQLIRIIKGVFEFVQLRRS
jgi:hypothetical protein